MAVLRVDGPDVIIMKQPQADQDSEYSFPYHYIPQFRGGYSQVRAWTWGTQYLSAIELVLDAMASQNKGVKSIADVGRMRLFAIPRKAQ